MCKLLWNITFKPILLIGNFIYSVVYRHTGETTKATLALVFLSIIIVSIILLRIIELQKGIIKINKGIIGKLSSIGSIGGYIYILLSLAVFMGLYIPSNTIQVSPVEFYTNHRTPLELIFNTFLLYFSLFCIWINLLIFLSPLVLRGIEKCFILTYFLSGIFNYYLFNGKNGLISSLLVYEKAPIISSFLKITGILLFFVIFILSYYILSKLSKKQTNKSTIRMVGLVFSLVFIAMSATCLLNITRVTREANIVQNTEKKEYEQILPISTDGQNIVVIMLDKAITGYVPYIFEDKPYLIEKFDGFTYYPNTVTFGQYTDLAAPSIYGGYEYTPININKRDNETLADKHNEALTVMPLLFSEHGFTATMCDPPYAGYQINSDISIYDQYPEINAYITQGVYLSKYEKHGIEYFDTQQQDAFFWYSVYRTVTPSLQGVVYDGGSYNSLDSSEHISQPFLDRYSVLDGMVDLTSIKQDNSDNFVFLQNETTHVEAHFLIEGCEELKPAYVVDYENMDKTIDGETLHFYDSPSYDFYVSNMISFIALGNWFDYLREQGAYDNTRIIIVSDHGNDLGQFKDRVFANGMDMERYSALLMVKDYNSTGFNTCEDLMTVADVPMLAIKDVIDNPKNPFTGLILNDDEKKNGNVVVTTTCKIAQGVGDYKIKKFDFSDGHLYRITNSEIYNEDSWEKVE